MVILVTNTIVPYCYDIAHVLGMPRELTHRFRYHEKWIKLPFENKEVVDSQCLIVLRDFDTGNLIPIRFGVITEILSVGCVNYIQIQLLDYFLVSDIDAVSCQLCKILFDKGYNNIAKTQLDCLVFKTDIAVSISDKVNKDEVQLWSDMLVKIGKMSVYEDYSFLKVLHVRDSKKKSVSVDNDDIKDYSYQLDPGKLYFLDVVQHVPWDIDGSEAIKSPYDVELKTETDEVIVLRKTQRVVGKYDLLRFIFKIPAGYTQKHTYLEVENKQGVELQKFGLPTLFLPITIRPSTFIKIIMWSRVLLGVIAIFHILASTKLSTNYGFEAEWIRSVSLLFLIIVSNKWEDYVKELVKGIGSHKL